MLTAISRERWAVAQEAEAAFWAAEDRVPLCRNLDALYRRALALDDATGATVLDLGGGPYPIASLLDLPVAACTVVDPLPFTDGLPRWQGRAEDYVGPSVDEVWGYNVLQHVTDPAAVIATAKRHARRRVRWFDWVETPIEDHHPHRIPAGWLAAQFPVDRWRVATTGGRIASPLSQRYESVIAERLT